MFNEASGTSEGNHHDDADLEKLLNAPGKSNRGDDRSDEETKNKIDSQVPGLAHDDVDSIQQQELILYQFPYEDPDPYSSYVDRQSPKGNTSMVTGSNES